MRLSPIEAELARRRHALDVEVAEIIKADPHNLQIPGHDQRGRLIQAMLDVNPQMLETYVGLIGCARFVDATKLVRHALTSLDQFTDAPGDPSSRRQPAAERSRRAADLIVDRVDALGAIDTAGRACFWTAAPVG